MFLIHTCMPEQKPQRSGELKNWLMQYPQQICIMHHHTVSPLNSCLVPAGSGTPALPVHIKNRDVFLQSGIELDLF